jgi:hypothetical protein
MRPIGIGAVLALTVVIPALHAAAAPAAQSQPFAGPKGWNHQVGATPTPQSPRAQESWKKDDGEFLGYFSDAGLSYDDVLAMVKKNVADNAIKTTVDTDRKCDGRRAHELEMSIGTSLTDQVIVDDAPGVTRLTYSRPQSTPKSPDVVSALNAYCGPGQ